MTADLDTKTGINKIVQIKPVTNQQELRCRGCAGNLSRIKRGLFVRTFLSWLPVKHYVCYRCSRKTYRLDRKA
jgi:hypothetical protein